MDAFTGCYLCGGSDYERRDGRVRDSIELEILECQNCGFVFLSDTSHIHEGFYEKSMMHEKKCEVQELLKETSYDNRRRIEYLRNRLTNADILDFGGGSGGFVLRAKDLAKSMSVVEPEIRFEKHYRENEIPHYKSIDVIKDTSFDLITAFHVVEHLLDPISVIRKLGDRLKPDGCLVVEVPNSEDALLRLYKSKAFSEFTYWSCHLYLYNASTLKILMKKSGLKTHFIKHIQRYPLSNHLYWLSSGMPGGHKFYDGLFNREIERDYEAALASVGMTDTIIGIFGKEAI